MPGNRHPFRGARRPTVVKSVIAAMAVNTWPCRPSQPGSLGWVAVRGWLVLGISGLMAGLSVAACSPSGAGGAAGAGQTARTRLPATASSSSPPRVVGPPSGDIPFPKFSYATCSSVQSADGSCLLPRQSSPTQAIRDRYASAYDEMTGLLSLCRAAGYSNCTRAGQHYLSASGVPLTVSMAGVYQEVPGFREQLQSWLRTSVAAALHRLRDTPPDRSASVTWDSGGAGRGWGSFDTEDANTDWHYTLGRFWARMAGDAWIGPVGPDGDRPVRIRYRSFLWDIYNFNAGSRFESLEDLAKAGMAADFLVTGASTTEVVSATIISIKPGSLVARAS